MCNRFIHTYGGCYHTQESVRACEDGGCLDIQLEFPYSDGLCPDCENLPHASALGGTPGVLYFDVNTNSWMGYGVSQYSGYPCATLQFNRASHPSGTLTQGGSARLASADDGDSSMRPLVGAARNCSSSQPPTDLGSDTRSSTPNGKGGDSVYTLSKWHNFEKDGTSHTVGSLVYKQAPKKPELKDKGKTATDPDPIDDDDDDDNDEDSFSAEEDRAFKLDGAFKVPSRKDAWAEAGNDTILSVCGAKSAHPIYQHLKDLISEKKKKLYEVSSASVVKHEDDANQSSRATQESGLCKAVIEHGGNPYQHPSPTKETGLGKAVIEHGGNPYLFINHTRDIIERTDELAVANGNHLSQASKACINSNTSPYSYSYLPTPVAGQNHILVYPYHSGGYAIAPVQTHLGPLSATYHEIAPTPATWSPYINSPTPAARQSRPYNHANQLRRVEAMSYLKAGSDESEWITLNDLEGHLPRGGDDDGTEMDGQKDDVQASPRKLRFNPQVKVAWTHSPRDYCREPYPAPRRG
ncbi:hypothetical protein BJ170DRAFT_589465 [Xylariales sp. AK1849]|nr:hypothetical protein BJ170DRAFT_589465 [Xylariales sp. AK1849]